MEKVQKPSNSVYSSLCFVSLFSSCGVGVLSVLSVVLADVVVRLLSLLLYAPLVCILVFHGKVNISLFLR
jgi:hypothetical protein